MKKPLITVIRNPVAGQRKHGFVDQVIQELEARGAQIQNLETVHAGHGEKLAAEISKQGKAELIVAAGGDGTIREIVSGLYGGCIPLGIIPAGTANVLARELGYTTSGRASIRQITDILMGDILRPMYPFEVKQGDEKQLGVCWLGAGFDATTLEKVTSFWKDKLGRLAFVPAIFRALAKERKNTGIKWRIDDGGQGRCGWAVVANVQRYAGPFRLTEMTSISTPGLACLLFKKTGIWARLVDQACVPFWPLDKRGSTKILASGSITIGNEETPLQLDGDYIGKGSAIITPLSLPLAVKSGE